MPKLNILIVDPDHQSAELLKDDLTEDGYEADMVTNGPDAFKRITNRQYNLAIIDRNLADIDSLRLCQKIRAENPTDRFAIIVISSFDDEEDREKAQSSGADEYLCKPFVYDTLAQLVARLASH